jgi:alcohol dehydrogenase class IV
MIMVAQRVFRMPVTIFGRSASDNIGPELKALGARKVFIVTDEVLWRLGVLKGIVSSLKAENLELHVYDNLPTEPTVEFVNDGIKLFKESGANIILAVVGFLPTA